MPESCIKSSVQTSCLILKIKTLPQSTRHQNMIRTLWGAIANNKVWTSFSLPPTKQKTHRLSPQAAPKNIYSSRTNTRCLQLTLSDPRRIQHRLLSLLLIPFPLFSFPLMPLAVFSMKCLSAVLLSLLRLLSFYLVPVTGNILCHDIYGRPTTRACDDAIDILGHQDRRTHFFGLSSVTTRPEGITVRAWSNRITLPVLVNGTNPYGKGSIPISDELRTLITPQYR